MPTINLTYPKPMRKTFPPAGQCIYCGKGPQETSLSKEHIIPFGLSGTLILPRASCPECAKITCDIETICLKKMFRDARIHLGLASRRKKRHKLPPPPLLVGRTGPTKKVERWEEIAKEKHPYHLVTCGFQPAGVLTGADPAQKPLHEFVMLPGTDWSARWRQQPRNVAIEYHVDSIAYSRLLAKIAHSYAAAKRGMSGFKPLLTDIILGKSDLAHYYVGGPEREKDDRSASAGNLHSIGLTTEGNLVIVKLRLFAFIEGTPNYIIVVGNVT